MPRMVALAGTPRFHRKILIGGLLCVAACGGASDPVEVPNQLAAGAAAYQDGRLNDCVTAYSSVLSVEPNSIVARAGRAACEPDSEEAVQDLDVATRASPQDPALLLARGDANSSLGNSTEAGTDYLHVVDLPQATPDQCVVAARSLIALHFYDDADRALTESLARFPSQWELHDELALVSGALDRDDAAQREFAAALAGTTGKNNASVLYDRARFAIARGNLQAALVDAGQALTEDPTNYGISEQRAQVRQSLGDYTGAEADFGVAMTNEARFWHDDEALIRLLTERSGVYLVEGERSSALADLYRAESLVPSSDATTRADIEQAITTAKTAA